jgi:hypothetical protein
MKDRKIVDGVTTRFCANRVVTLKKAILDGNCHCLPPLVDAARRSSASEHVDIVHLSA